MFNKILIAIDSGAPAIRAVQVGVELAEQVRAHVAVLHVVDTSRAFVPEFGVADDIVIAALERDGNLALDAAIARIPENIKYDRFLVEGDPSDTIIQTAREWGADLVIVGTDSRGRLAHFLLGSTADAVVRKAGCPVMTVRADAETASHKSLAAEATA